MRFTKWEDPTVFNLAFGDTCANGHVDDSIVTDNGDRDKIFATVAAAVNIFTKRILIIGCSSPAAQILGHAYRMAINKHLLELRQLYEIYTIINGKPVVFHRRFTVNSFLIRRKI